MRASALLAVAAAVILLPVLGSASAPADSPESVRLEARSSVEMARKLLERAIAIRYACDSRARIDLRMRDGRGGERHRRIQTIAKHIDGRMHSIGRLISPQRLRGMTILSIEARDRGDDVFVYLPSLGRVRRVSMGRRADSFLGSDLTYQDLDRQRADDYRIESLTGDLVEGEPVHLITARPRRPQTYQRIAFRVARSDLAILELRYYKAGDARASRIVRFPRASIHSSGGNLVPTRIHVTNTLRGSETDVRITELEVNPEIDDRLFSILTLRTERAFDPAGDARKRTGPDER